MTQDATPLRLVDAEPLERLTRTLEALLVIASTPLTPAELAAAADKDKARVESALDLVGERDAEGRSGIVLEHVAGGYAFRAARAEAAACARLFEKPVERGPSQAALETLAIVAYLGPCTRPDVAGAGRGRGDGRRRAGRARARRRGGREPGLGRAVRDRRGAVRARLGSSGSRSSCG